MDGSKVYLGRQFLWCSKPSMGNITADNRGHCLTSHTYPNAGILFFWNRVSLRSPNWATTHYVNQTGLKLTEV